MRLIIWDAIAPIMTSLYVFQLLCMNHYLLFRAKVRNNGIYCTFYNIPEACLLMIIDPYDVETITSWRPIKHMKIYFHPNQWVAVGYVLFVGHWFTGSQVQCDKFNIREDNFLALCAALIWGLTTLNDMEAFEKDIHSSNSSSFSAHVTTLLY